MCAFCCTCQLDSERVKAPVHYWHNTLHGGSHSDVMSAVGLFVLCTQKCTRYGPCPSQALPSPPLSPQCQGVFHLSGLIHCQYPEVELHSLGRVFYAVGW